MQKLTTIEKASVISAESTKAYISLHSTFLYMRATLKGDQLVQLEKAAPIMNQAKRHLISYNKVVIAWRESGGTAPKDLLINKQALDELLAQASTIILGLI